MSDATTHLLLPYILAAQAQKHVTCAHHGDPATDSMNIRPPIPRRSGHRFHAHPATLV